jgi:hypothetical protein
MLSAELELSHPSDRRRLRHVGEDLVNYSLRPYDRALLREQLVADVGNLLACCGNGSLSRAGLASWVVDRLTGTADWRLGADALTALAKEEILVACVEAGA